jgi:hypothetical protein
MLCVSGWSEAARLMVKLHLSGRWTAEQAFGSQR